MTHFSPIAAAEREREGSSPAAAPAAFNDELISLPVNATVHNEPNCSVLRCYTSSFELQDCDFVRLGSMAFFARNRERPFSCFFVRAKIAQHSILPLSATRRRAGEADSAQFARSAAKIGGGGGGGGRLLFDVKQSGAPRSAQSTGG